MLRTAAPFRRLLSRSRLSSRTGIRLPARAISLTAGLNHGRLTLDAVTLNDLILQAYDLLRRDQVVGCPAWCDSERFDLVATTEDPNITKVQAMPMLQALLVERFQLKSHRETKEVAGFALAVGKAGPRLKQPGEEGALGFSVAGRVLTFRKMPIAGLVSYIAGTARQPVIDMTGLKGSFDFTIDLTSQDDLSPGTDARSDAIDTFTRLRRAVEDQLGLKLEPRKVAVDNLVVESAAMPSEN